MRSRGSGFDSVIDLLGNYLTRERMDQPIEYLKRGFICGGLPLRYLFHGVHRVRRPEVAANLLCHVHETA
jgi:hypothetical protein